MADTHEPDLRRYYSFKAPEFEPGDMVFSVALVRPGASTLPLDAVLEDLEWTDENELLAGTCTLRRPDSGNPASLPIGRGHRVRLRTQWGGEDYELWQMRVQIPSIEDGTVLPIELRDDMDLVRRTKKDRLARKNKRHPRGVLPHDALREAARRDGVQLGAIAETKTRIRHLSKKACNLLDWAKALYKRETDKTGRAFVFRMRDGRFEVVPYGRNRIAYRFGSQIQTYSMQRVGAQKPVTVVTGRGRVGKGRRARKLTYTATSSVVQRLGYSHDEHDFGVVDDLADLRSQTRRYLARKLRLRKAITITVPLVPFVRRGDAVIVDLPEEGFKGEEAFMFVASATHSMNAGSRTTVLELVETDHFAKYQEEQEKELREKKRRERRARAN